MGRKRLQIDIKKVITLYRKGLTTRQIAAQTKMSHDTVQRRLKEAGQPLRRWRMPDDYLKECLFLDPPLVYIRYIIGS